MKNDTVVKSTPKSGGTRQRILDAAAHLFREQGYSARLTDIAEEAGVKTGSLYYHFKGRDDLVDEVLRRAMDKLSDYVEAELATLPEDSTALDKLMAAVRADAKMALEVSDYSAANTRIFPVLSGDMREKQ
ncbi:MAG: TetR family transcriptional regulator, partial [Haliea sp.]